MSDEKQALWEILVPTVREDGRPYRTRFHRVWDEKVKKVANGLTVVSPVKGVWVSKDGDTFKERMIPVRIMCTRDQIIEIAHMTKDYYEQLAVMVSKVSDDVFIID